MPLHLLMARPELIGPRTSPLVHVHYHWLFTDLHYQRALTLLRDLSVGQDRLDWLNARLPLQSC